MQDIRYITFLDLHVNLTFLRLMIVNILFVTELCTSARAFSMSLQVLHPCLKSPHGPIFCCMCTSVASVFVADADADDVDDSDSDDGDKGNEGNDNDDDDADDADDDDVDGGAGGV